MLHIGNIDVYDSRSECQFNVEEQTLDNSAASVWFGWLMHKVGCVDFRFVCCYDNFLYHDSHKANTSFYRVLWETTIYRNLSQAHFW